MYVYVYIYIFFFVCVFPVVCATQDLTPHLGVESVPPAFEALTHPTARESPLSLCFVISLHLLFVGCFCGVRE